MHDTGNAAAIEAPCAYPSLIGGPLHSLGAALRLVEGENPIRLGLAIAGVLWIVLVVLAFIGGTADRVFVLDVIGGHIRILLAIPLMFACEAALTPHLKEFCDGLVRTGIVTDAARPALRLEAQRFNRLIRSPLVEAALAVLAVAAFWVPPDAVLPGGLISVIGGAAAGDVGLAGEWYWYVCLPVFRFLILRWVWRLLLWWFLLWRLSRLDLHLLATHPDRAAGLGYLATVQGAFVSLIVAISLVIAGSLAGDIATTGVKLRELYPLIAVVLILDAAFFVAPLYIFIQNLRRARSKALIAYMDLAAGYVNAFDRKWLRGAEPGEPLLGSPDVQSLADLDSAVGVIEETRVAPVSKKLLMRFGIAAIVPFAPLLLFEFPLSDLALRALHMLIGG